MKANALVTAAAVALAQTAEQVVFGPKVIGFYFGESLLEYGEQAPIVRVAISLAPIGFIVVPAIIGAICACILPGTDVERFLGAFAVSLLGHLVYVLLAYLAQLMFGMFLLSFVFDALILFIIGSLFA